MFPRVTLIGTVVRDPEPRTSSNNETYCRLSVACNRYNFREKKNDTAFFAFGVFKTTANYVLRNVKKGDIIYIDGNLVTRNYTTREGSKIVANEITVRELEKVFSRSQSSPNTPRSSSRFEQKSFDSSPQRPRRAKKNVIIEDFEDDSFAPRRPLSDDDLVDGINSDDQFSDLHEQLDELSDADSEELFDDLFEDDDEMFDDGGDFDDDGGDDFGDDFDE